MSDTGKLTPLRPRRDSVQFATWRLVKPKGAESCRWEAADGRWISLTLGRDAEIGSVVFADSSGARELIDSYEGALELAKSRRR